MYHIDELMPVVCKYYFETINILKKEQHANPIARAFNHGKLDNF